MARHQGLMLIYANLCTYCEKTNFQVESVIPIMGKHTQLSTGNNTNAQGLVKSSGLSIR